MDATPAYPGDDGDDDFEEDFTRQLITIDSDSENY